MSPSPARMPQKKEVVLNSVAEFLGIWAVRGEASLSLNTKDGVTTIAFAHSLSGHPEDPLFPPPALTGTPRQRRRRRRGPARRERDRQRAARHQAAQAGAPPASPPMGAPHQCDQCEKSFKTESGLKIHMGKSHKPPPAELPKESLRQSDEGPSCLSASPLLDISREDVVREEEPMFGCDQCDYVCILEENFVTHMVEIHQHYCAINPAINCTIACPGCLVP